jgi:formylglycine-generating enzyme required for sulfatase activity
VAGNQVSLPVATYSVSGLIILVSSGLANVSVSAGTGTTAFVTSTTGAFSISGLPNGSYTITPTLAGYSFTPAFATIVVNGSNVQTGADFTAAVQTASYTLTPGTLTYGTMTPATSLVVTSGVATNIVATANSGYYFTGWSANPAANAVFVDASAASTTVTLTGNATVTPTFSVTPPTTYTLTPGSSSNGTMTPATATTVYAGTATTIVASAASGYTLSSWTVSPPANVTFISGATNAVASVTLTGNATVTPTFSVTPPITYTLTPGSPLNGTMTPATAMTVNAGSATTIIATANSGYVFSAWSANPGTNAAFTNASAASTSVALSGSATITPTFAVAPPTTYTLTPGSSLNGTMTPAIATTVNAGAATTITATANSGYSFTGWSANPAGNAVFANGSFASTTVTLTGSATITPSFAVSGTGSTVPTNGLVAEYLFNGNANDTSGSGYNGTALGAGVTAVPDRFGQASSAYSFNGASYMSTGYHVPTGALPKSFSVWFSPAALTRGWIIAGGTQAGVDGAAFGLFTEASGALYFHGNGLSDVAFTHTVAATGLYHVVVTYDSSNTLSCYFNGQFDTSASRTLNTGSSDDVWLGLVNSGQGYYFNGIIDDARFYNRALSSTEVGTLYHEGGWAGISMVPVAGGTFSNGSSSVTVSSFQISKYEITQAKYQTVVGTNPSHFTGDLNRPVDSVTWFDAAEFCNKLSMQAGLDPVYAISGRTPSSGNPITAATVTADWTKNGYRLATEAEWDYAAIGGQLTHGYTYSGSNTVDSVAWYSGNSGGSTHPVGMLASNELGIYDMSGNAWEWCWDVTAPYPTVPTADPTGPDTDAGGYGRAIHGGSYVYNAAGVSWFSRYVGILPGTTTNDLGIRVVRRP